MLLSDEGQIAGSGSIPARAAISQKAQAAQMAADAILTAAHRQASRQRYSLVV
jgi:cell division septum initiation protein DivIVA